MGLGIVGRVYCCESFLKIRFNFGCESVMIFILNLIKYEIDCMSWVDRGWKLVIIVVVEDFVGIYSLCRNEYVEEME